ncbi:MAG: hypothetical protein FWH11_03370 [Micrococcales bacterium]|nr:hypothetical protein [Micrococcales bacterium]
MSTAETQPPALALDGPQADQAERRDRAGSDQVPVPGPRTVRRPVVVGWARSWSALGVTVRWAVGWGWHWVSFHAVRLPWYLVRLVVRSPLGAARLVQVAWRWTTDQASAESRRAVLAQTSSPDQFLRLVKDHRQVRDTRAAVVGLVVAVVAAAMVAVFWAGPVWVRVGAVVVLLAALGLAAPRRSEVVGSAALSAQVPPLTADLVRDALGSLGLAQIDKALREDPKALRFLLLARDGAGFRCDVDLPPGATAEQVVDRRSRLASGLRRPLGCVWPQGDPEVHEGRLTLYVADRSLSEAAPAPWPLARTGRTNLFEPVPLGVDPRGKPVTVTPMFASGLIGAVPRMGKTFLLRQLLLAAALDPRCEIHCHNLKGGADLDPLAPVAHYLRSGDDPEDLAALMADARALQTDMRRRYRTIRGLDRQVCPESKVTDVLASDRRLRLHPVFVGLDETQVLFEHSTFGGEAVAIFTDLVKRGPAVGIMVWLATQRPNAASVPPGISANATLRLCLRVMGHVENDMILGTGAYKAGTRATMFSRRDLGVAILVGEGADPVIVRSAYVDGPTAETIAARAAAARKAAGRLSGMAAGQIPADTDTGSVLDHLLACWPDDQPKLWCDELAARLGAHLPALYTGWTGEQVSAAAKPHGIVTVQVKRTVNGRAVNKRGLARASITAALGQADDDPPPEVP